MSQPPDRDPHAGFALHHAAGDSHEQADATFKVGNLEVDLRRRHVSVAAVDVRLIPIIEYRLLATPVAQAGKVVTHQQLLRDVWARTMSNRLITCASTWLISEATRGRAGAARLSAHRAGSRIPSD